VSQYDTIRLYCEGTAGSLDVDLLDRARRALESRTNGHPLARVVEIRSAGSKLNLKPLLTAVRDADSRARVYAVRDRDFLPRELATKLRGSPRVEPWPLQRHSIESYLIDPGHLDSALGQSSLDATSDGAHFEPWVALLERLAAEQFWPDVVTACREQIAFDIRSVRPATPEVSNREQASAAVQALVAAFPEKVRLALPSSPDDLVNHYERDFAEDGPVWTRVRGDRLLAKLLQRVEKKNLGFDVRKRLVTHAPPQALVDALEHLLNAIQRDLTPGVVGAPTPPG